MCSAVTPTGWRWLDVDDALALRPALRSFPPNLWIKKSASVFLLLIAATSKRALASRPAKARLAFADHGTPSQMVVDGKCDHAPRHSPRPTLCLGTQLSPAILVRGCFLSVASDDTNFRPAPLSRWDLGRLFAGLVRRRLAGKALGVRQTTDPQRSLLDQSPPLGMRRHPVRSLAEVYHVLCSELPRPSSRTAAVSVSEPMSYRC
jgi:hypothetical protein